MNKTEARRLMRGDYIPDGPGVLTKGLAFRRTLEHEVYRCAARTGYDVQSGPIYCGDLAEWARFEVDSVIACCSRHFPHDAVKEKEVSPEVQHQREVLAREDFGDR